MVCCLVKQQHKLELNLTKASDIPSGGTGYYIGSAVQKAHEIELF